ncbi:MAG: hypothetical protein LBT85_00735 [Bifidobacteriaceae bacterium]|nr:hypothetical protein [Bifidobacteriaceae bacterium]
MQNIKNQYAEIAHKKIDKSFFIVIIVLFAFVLRVSTFFIANNSFGFVPFYDEAVHYSLANSVLYGQKLYVDQIFLHPPSIITFSMPFAALGSVISDMNALIVQSVFMCLLGAVNTYLIYSLAIRFCSKKFAFFVAFIYAIFPISVSADQRGIIEPVLNCFILIGLMFLVKQKFSNELNYKLKYQPQIIFAGVCFGAASSLKVWGGAFTAVIFVLFLVYKEYRKSIVFIISSLFAFLFLSIPYFINNFSAVAYFFKYILLDQAAVTMSGVEIWKKFLGFAILALWLIFVPNLVRKYLIYSNFAKNFVFCCVSVFTGLSLGLIILSRQYWHYWDWFIPFALIFLGGVFCYIIDNAGNNKRFLFGQKSTNLMISGCSVILFLFFVSINFYHSFYSPEPFNVSQPFKISYIKSADGISALHDYIVEKQENSQLKSLNKCVYSYADVLVIANFVTLNYQNNCFIQADIYGEFIKNNPTKISDDMYEDLPKYALNANAPFVLIPSGLRLYFIKNAFFLQTYTKDTAINNIDIWQKNNISL